MMNKKQDVYRLIVRRLAAVSAIATVLVVSAGSAGQASAIGAGAGLLARALSTVHPTVAVSPGPGAPQPGLLSVNNANKQQRALVAANLAAPLTALPASTCTLSGSTRTCDLYAIPGNLLVPGSQATSLPVWGFSTDPIASDPVPGAVLVANEGETLVINLHNNLPAGDSGDAVTDANAISLELPAFGGVPDQTGVARTAVNAYNLGTLSKPGTFLYEAGPTPDGARQVRMGLAGMLVVRPTNFAACADAYDFPNNACNAASEFVDETPLALNEFDPALNTDPFKFDPFEFSPSVYTINGVAYDPKAPLNSKFDVLPGDVVMLRYANYGDHERAITVSNERQLTLADDSIQLPNVVDNATKWLNPGQVADTFLTIDPAFKQGTEIPVYDAGFHLNNGPDTGLGGSFAYFNVAQSIGGNPAGPTVTVNVSPPTNSSVEDVTVTGTITPSAGASLSDAEWFLDNPGIPGSAPTSPLPPLIDQHIAVSGTAPFNYSFTIPSATLNFMLASAVQRDGDHTIWVHARDTSGAGATATGPLTPTTLTDSNASWNVNQWVGATATIGTASMAITSNSPKVLTGSGWLPGPGQNYTVTLSEPGTKTTNFAGAGDSVGSGTPACLQAADVCLVDPTLAASANQWVGATLKVGASSFIVTSNSATVLDGAAWTGGAPTVPQAYTLTLNDATAPCAVAGGCLVDPTQSWAGLNWNGAVVTMGGDTLTVTSSTVTELDGSAGWTPAVPAAPAPYTISYSHASTGIDTVSVTDGTAIWAANQWTGAVVNVGGNTMTVLANTGTTLSGAGWIPTSLAYALGGGTWGVATGDVFAYNATGPVVADVTLHLSPTNGSRSTDVANGGGAIDPVTKIAQDLPNTDLIVLGEADSSLSNFIVTAAEYCIDGALPSNCASPQPIFLTPSGSDGTQQIDSAGNPLTTSGPCTPVPTPLGLTPPGPPAAPGGGSVVSFCGDIPAATLNGLGEGAHTLYIYACEQVTAGPGCATQPHSRWTPTTPDNTFKFAIDKTGPNVSSISLDPNPNNGHLGSQGNLNFLDSLQVAAELSDPVTNGVNSNIALGEVFMTCSPNSQASCKSTDPVYNSSGVLTSGGPIDTVTGAVVADGSGAEMIPSGAAWDSPNKLAYAYIPLATLTQFPEGHVRFWVHAKDIAGNYGHWFFTELTYDKTPPVIDSPPLTTTMPCTGASGCTINFTAHDPTSGGVSSNIVQAEWFIDQGVHLVCEAGEIGPGCTIEVAVTADPGYGNGTPITITPGNPVNGQIVLGPMPANTHIVFRVRDAAGNWSLLGLVTTT